MVVAVTCFAVVIISCHNKNSIGSTKNGLNINMNLLDGKYLNERVRV